MSPYKVLNVPEGSSLDVCKKSYRDICKKHHPDSGGDSDIFTRVSIAWDEIKKLSNMALEHKCGITHKSLFTFE